MYNGVPGFKLAIKDKWKIKVPGVCVIATSKYLGVIGETSEVKVVMDIDPKGLSMPVVLHVPSSQCFSTRQINLGATKDEGL